MTYSKWLFIASTPGFDSAYSGETHRKKIASRLHFMKMVDI